MEDLEHFQDYDKLDTLNELPTGIMNILGKNKTKMKNKNKNK